jgi:hypothetical protein
MKKLSELSYEELYELVVVKGGVDFGGQKPNRTGLEGCLDEIDPKLIEVVDLDTIEFR